MTKRYAASELLFTKFGGMNKGPEHKHVEWIQSCFINRDALTVPSLALKILETTKIT